MPVRACPGAGGLQRSDYRRGSESSTPPCQWDCRAASRKLCCSFQLPRHVRVPAESLRSPCTTMCTGSAPLPGANCKLLSFIPAQVALCCNSCFSRPRQVR